VLVCVTLVLGAGVYGGVELYKKRLVDDSNEQVAATAERTARQLDAAVDQKRDFVGFVASRPRTAAFDRSDSYLRSIVDNSRFFAAQVVAANGTLIDMYGDVTGETQQEAIGSNVGDRRYVQAALEGRTYMSELRRANGSQKSFAVFSAPVFEDRRIVGVLAMSIYVDRSTLFATVQPLETEAQTVQIWSGDELLYGAPESFDDAIGRSATVEATDWRVTVVRDRSGLVDRLRILAIVQGASLCGVLLAVVAFGRWEYRTMVAQVERLLAGFTALKRGRYDHSAPLEAGEEWQRIGDAFDDLAATLEAREEQLQAHEQRLAVLNRVLRHNLRNEMGIVRGYAELVAARSSDPQVAAAGETITERADALTDLGNKARRVEDLIGDETAPRPVDVSEAVREVVDDVGSGYPAVTVETTIPDGARATALPTITAAIEYVCENACEHNVAADPHVHVDVETREEVVTVRVRDNGAGIPEHEREVLLSGEEEPLHHGSGLGLWLVHWIVERSGGELSFEEDGAVVVLELDRADEAGIDRAFETGGGRTDAQSGAGDQPGG